MITSQTKKYPFTSIYFGNKDLIKRVKKVARKEKKSVSYIVCRAIKRDLRNNYILKDGESLDKNILE